jgi:hypothetical protein
METVNLEQTEFTQTLLSGVDKLEEFSKKELEAVIKEQIIPQMNQRREREEPMDCNEIYTKLNNPPCSDKPGEIHEWSREIAKDTSIVPPQEKDVAIALELADIVYYTLQPNSKENYGLFWEIYLGGPQLAYVFCVIKYKTRLEYGDREDYKEIESYVMANYLKDLRNNRNNRYNWFFSE